MTQYAVVAFPQSDALARVEALRRRFDPQALLLPAHVTLVFSFTATASIDERPYRGHSPHPALS